ncbi:hypothetical protein D3C77_381120 [compost metagenome]
MVVMAELSEYREHPTQHLLLTIDRFGLAASLQPLRPILGEQRPGHLPSQRVAQRGIYIVEFLAHRLPCFQGLAMVTPPEFDKLGERPVVCRAVQPLFVVLGGNHPALELLCLRLGLEALADPLALPPLRADIDQVPIGRGLDAHRPSLYRKALTHPRGPHTDTVPNHCTLTVITLHQNTVVLYSI